MEIFVKNLNLKHKEGVIMNLTTIARDFDYELPLFYEEKHSFNNIEALDSRFCVVLITNGTGVLTVNQNKFIFRAPCVLCINEKEHMVIEEQSDFDFQIIYFHPSVINSALNFETIRNLPENAPITLYQDSYWNKFFLTRSENYHGIISIGPMTMKRLTLLYANLNNEISNQNRENWPCRSRSYFLEILFTIDNVSIEEISLEEPLLLQLNEDFAPILLYLYNNYDQKITVEDITTKFNINRTTLSKMFRDNVNDTFISFLNKLRISIAAQLLRDTKLPISEIMYRVGMNDSVHFLRTFKKYTELSPSEYRKKYCWM